MTKTLAGHGQGEPYALTMRATDGGALPLFSEVPVSLLIGDVAPNEGVPYISKPASGEIARVAEVPFASFVKNVFFNLFFFLCFTNNAEY